MFLLQCIKQMPRGPESNFLSHGILFYFLDALILGFRDVINSGGRVSGFSEVVFDAKWVILKTSGQLGKHTLA